MVWKLVHFNDSHSITILSKLSEKCFVKLSETGIISSGLEMKSANSDIQFARLRNPNLLVDEHMAQVQFQMFISGANSWYLTSYNESFDDPKDRLIICKVLRNNAIIEKFHNQVIEMESYINDVLFDIKHLADIESVW